MMRRSVALLYPAALLVLLTACGGTTDKPKPIGEDHPAFDPYEGEETGAVATYDLAGKGWHDTPFPTDLRRQADTGKIDLSGFPEPKKGKPEPLISLYSAVAEATLTGFSIQPTVFVAFDKPLRAALLPTPSESYSSDKSGVWLINVDAESPGYGERVPLRVRLSGEKGGNLLRPNMLMAQPTWGTPLREATSYALVVSRAMRDTDDHVLARPEALAAAIDGLTGATKPSKDPAVLKLAETLAPLAQAWTDGHLPIAPRAVGAATVFTTGQPTAQLKAIASWVRDEVPRKAAYEWKQDGKKHEGYRLYRGKYDAPNFQAGKAPYLDAGGGFVFDDKGAPVVQQTESLRVSIAVPDDRVHAVGGLLPVIIYSHGTGGSYESYRNGGDLSPARLLTEMGMVVIGIDQPLHGPRAGTKLSRRSIWPPLTSLTQSRARAPSTWRHGQRLPDRDVARR